MCYWVFTFLDLNPVNDTVNLCSRCSIVYAGKGKERKRECLLFTGFELAINSWTAKRCYQLFVDAGLTSTTDHLGWWVEG